MSQNTDYRVPAQTYEWGKGYVIRNDPASNVEVTVTNEQITKVFENVAASLKGGNVSS